MVPPPTSSGTQNEAKQQRYTFIYKNVEYDATEYLNRHPGGPEFIKNMKSERDDLTEYFKALHSKQAQKIIQSFPVVRRVEQTEASKDYLMLETMVEHLYQPLWHKEAAIWGFLALILIWAHSTSCFALSVVLFGVQQIITGWESHSAAHSRNKNLMALGTRLAALLGGFSLSWWSPKHNMHHMFTNSKYDGDIQHEYKLYLYPFLYLKWRFDSLMEAINTRNYMDLILIGINYAFLYHSGQWLSFVVGLLIAGFYSAHVLIGNHEREHRFPKSDKIEMTFMDHQIITCRNYWHKSFFWLMMMGGMQYQTEHHLFPQIPFYRIPEAEGIIEEYLSKTNRKIIYGPVL